MVFKDNSKKDWKSVLIIDDDEALIKTLRPILINAGYSVLTANSGEAGLSVIENQNPDMVLLDVILPGIKGREVCQAIKENPQTKDMPVVFLTAKDSPDDIQAELDVGAEAHITKPVNAKQLLETVGKYLS
jgi:CheY-like chemotaxis protein